MNHRNRKRILLADNSQEYRRSVIGFLELEGYAVTEAETPEQALEMLEQKTFDLVLADLRMRNETDRNDVSGLEIAKFASACGIPCIIVTAFPTVELARFALRARRAEPFAKDLITKASGPEALLDSIGVTLEHMEQGTRTAPRKGLYIDLEKKLVWKDGEKINFRLRQYHLLAALWIKDGGVCTYAELIKTMYDEELSDLEAINDTRVKKVVDRVKEKIEDKDSNSPYIETVPGMGYRLNHKQ